MTLQQRVDAFIGIIVGRALRKSQADGLAIFVACALRLTRSILTELAVQMRQHGFAHTVKHALKRLDRWINNRRVTVGAAMGPVLEKLLKRRKKKLLISLDWVDIRSFKTLVAAGNIKGRAVWLLWASVPKSGLNLNMYRMEEALLMDLKQLLPKGLRVIVLADRGFHKTRLFGLCQKLHLDYVIRLKADYTVAARRYQGLLTDLPVKPGCRHFWQHARCGLRPVIVQNIVVYYEKNLPEKRDEPWFLATSLTATARQIVRLFARRMGIEECFRDHKSVNGGWGLRHVRLQRADNLDRLLLILAWAYLVLCGLGLYALGHLAPRLWCANNRKGECGVFTIARRLLGYLEIPMEQVFLEIGLCSKALAPKWG
jgi:hypothetical protein